MPKDGYQPKNFFPPLDIPPNCGSSVKPPLTRTELRRQEKENAKASKTITMTMEAFHNSLKLAAEEERQRIFETVVEQYSAAIAIVDRDKMGYGKLRLARHINWINEAFMGILGGYYTVKDIKETIKKETGYEIMRRSNNG